MVQRFFNHVLEANVSEQFQATRYEREEAQRGYRNGSYSHRFIPC
ncbi:transposase [Sulfobacillus thermosulfidooxidans]